MSSYTPVKLAFNVVEPQSGANGSPPIIFAHGLSGSKEHWEDIAQTFADKTKRKVYAIDARNHGDSEWNDVFNFDSNVDDLLHFMDSEKIPKAIIIGHSMGGLTGIKTAIMAPERVEKLIVEDMSVKVPPVEVVGLVSLMLSILRKSIEQVPNDVDEATAKQIVFSVAMTLIPEELKNLVKPDTMKNLKISLKRLEDGRYVHKSNLDVLERVLKDENMMKPIEGTYDGSALFVYGKESPFNIGSDELNIKKHFPNAELTGIEEATHSVHFDQPQEFSETVLKFILKE